MELPLDKNYESIDGESLVSLNKGKNIPEKIAYSETGNPLHDTKPPKEPNVKSIRTTKWKLIINEYDNTRELYNLEEDPNEEENLANSGLEIEQSLWSEFLKINNNS